MKHTPRFTLYFTMIFGIVGTFLQYWLHSATDHAGLLPAHHVAGILLILLSVLYLVFLALQTRRISKSLPCCKIFPASAISAALTVLSAVGILMFTLSLVPGINLLAAAPLTLGAVTAICLLLLAVSRLRGKSPRFFPALLPTLFTIFATVTLSRSWGKEPQWITYVFELLAVIFLMFSTFYHTSVLAREHHSRALCFCTQAALYFCCLSALDTARVYYLSMGLLMFSWSLGNQEE